MASSCLAFGLPFPNHKSKPIQSFAWITFYIPTKCITSNLWQNFSLTHFIIQISEFSELPKNKFSPLVQQWHSESLRQKRFYLELDLWGKYSWYIDTVDTLREIQLKHSGKYSWYRGRSDCILRWDLCGSGQARISCITDRCSQRYALVNLGLQLYLAWSLFVCPPPPIFLLACCYLDWGTPDTWRPDPVNMWPQYQWMCRHIRAFYAAFFIFWCKHIIVIWNINAWGAAPVYMIRISCVSETHTCNHFHANCKYRDF